MKGAVDLFRLNLVWQCDFYPRIDRVFALRPFFSFLISDQYAKASLSSGVRAWKNCHCRSRANVHVVNCLVGETRFGSKSWDRSFSLDNKRTSNSPLEVPCGGPFCSVIKCCSKTVLISPSHDVMARSSYLIVTWWLIKQSQIIVSSWIFSRWFCKIWS